MHVVMLYHSLVSDWNHGNAHFLRGVVTELLTLGHSVDVYEPRGGWSLSNLIAECGNDALASFAKVYPRLKSRFYDLETFDLDAALDGADLVLVHEWNDPRLVRMAGQKRAQSHHFRLLFHDTHHRCATRRHEMAAYDLSHYDGVLAFGDVIREIYLEQGWAKKAWTWHEAADTRVFHYRRSPRPAGDLVWVGNWGDDERTGELNEFLIGPIARLKLRAQVYGVRYPEEGKQALKAAGIRYRGWLPNFEVPAVFARHRVTVHVPRRPYRDLLPGIPTIRVFEALACGIPLVSAPWRDAERLFSPRQDYLVARNGLEMESHLRMLLNEPSAAKSLAEHGLRAILKRHTCSHRVQELLAIAKELGIATTLESTQPVRGPCQRTGSDLVAEVSAAASRNAPVTG